MAREHPPDPITVETFAESLPDRYLSCRELGHQWRAWRAQWDASARAFERELRCGRCKTTRAQLLDSRGHVLSNRYTYPTGYQAKGVEGAVRVSRDVFRLESITRYLTPKDERQAS